MAESSIDEGNSSLPSGGWRDARRHKSARPFKISLQNRALCRAWIINYSIMKVLFGYTCPALERRIEKYV